MVDRSKVACFSGHRKLPQDCTELQANLEKAIIELIERGVVFFGNALSLVTAKKTVKLLITSKSSTSPHRYSIANFNITSKHRKIYNIGICNIFENEV